MRPQLLLSIVILAVNALISSAAFPSLKSKRLPGGVFVNVRQWLRSHLSRPSILAVQRNINLKLGREKSASSVEIVNFLTEKIKIKRVVALMIPPVLRDTTNAPSNQQGFYLLNEWKDDNRKRFKMDYYTRKNLSGIKKSNPFNSILVREKWISTM